MGKISPQCIECLRGGQCGPSRSVNDRPMGLDLVCDVVAHTNIGQDKKVVVFADPLQQIIVRDKIRIPAISVSKTEPRKTVLLQSWNFETGSFETVVAIKEGNIVKPNIFNRRIYGL